MKKTAKVRLVFRSLPVRATAVSAVAVLGSMLPVYAQFTEYTWSGFGVNNNFSSPINWVGNSAPVSGSTRRLRFNPSLRKTVNNDLPTAYILNQLTFADSGYNLTGGTYNFQAGNGVNPQIRQTVAGSNTIASNLSLSSVLTINVQDAGGTLNLTGVVSGAGLTKAGAGVLTLSRVGNTLSGDLQVNEGQLSLISGGTLSSTNGWLGSNASNNGGMNVTGKGSQWTNSGNLLVGYLGNGNLTISGGGNVSSFLTSLGDQAGSLGFVLVTGSGSQLAQSDNLRVGASGNGFMTVNAGGSVLSFNSLIGWTATGNGSVTITGLGSQWTNKNTLVIGYEGNASLTISDQAQVSNFDGYIGYLGNSVGTVLVTGSGSQWTNRGNLVIAGSGTGTLTISDGARVTVSGETFLANAAKSSLVMDGGMLLTGTLSGTVGSTITLNNTNNRTNTLSLTSDSTFIGTIKGNGSLTKIGASALTLTGASNAFSGNINVDDGTLVLSSGGTMSSSNVSIGSNVKDSATLQITGVSSTWTNTNDIRVGDLGTGDLKIFAGGTLLSNASGWIGDNSGSNGTVTIEGTGSQWKNLNELYVGNEGSGTLTLTKSGTVTNVTGYIGMAPGSKGTVTISGRGSLWTNSGNLTVGDSGEGTLTIHGSGRVISNEGSVGGNATGNGNVTISGANSRWDNNNALAVGDSGTGTLTINSGGTASNLTGYLGYHTSGKGTATVSGADSLWNNSGNLVVGYGGTGALNINSGGQVSNINGTIADQSGSNGTVTVTDAASKWNNTGDLFVGSGGTGTLTIDGAGNVSNINGYIGWASTGNGTVTVSGIGSQWSSLGSVFIGSAGTGALVLNNGGLASVAGTTYLNNGANSSLTLNGGTLSTGALIGTAGSTLILNSEYSAPNTLWIANDSTFNGTISGPGQLIKIGAGTLTLTATNNSIGPHLKINEGGIKLSTGGSLQSFTGYIGDDSSGVGAMTVDQAQWNVTNQIAIGNSGTGTLILQNGGKVFAPFGSIGTNAGSAGSVTVSGAGSLWSSPSNVKVGNFGSGTLDINSGGAVTTAFAEIGYGAGSAGSATVSGAGSKLQSTQIFVGGYGNGALMVNNGATVTDFYGHIGYNAGSTGTATVSGVGSQWNNSNYLIVGVNGTGAITVYDGGTVSHLTGYLGYYSGSKGTATVSGNGSQWNNTLDLFVGREGGGTLTVSNGGTVSVGGTTYLNHGADSALVLSRGNMITGALSGDAGSTITLERGSFFSGVGYSNLSIATDSLFAGTISGGGNLVKSGAGTLTLTGRSSNDAIDQLEISEGGISLINGGTLSGSVIISSAGGSASLNIAGPGSSWTGSSYPRFGIESSYLIVAESGTGTLNVSGGGSLSTVISSIGNTSNSIGVATVTGQGSRWTNTDNLYIGYLGNGTLNINNGGVVSTGSSRLGVTAFSAGAGTVSGPGSRWENSNLLSIDIGTIDINNGATVTNGTGIIGKGNATISGQGSLWDNRGNLLIGSISTTTFTGGTATLTISGGAVVTNAIASIGDDAASTGTVTLSGTGSKWINNSDLYVGSFGKGKLTIGNGTEVSSVNGYIGAQEGSDGTVTISGTGTWKNTGDLFIGKLGTGKLSLDRSSISVAGATNLNNGNLSSLVMNGATLTTGSLAGTGNIAIGNASTLSIANNSTFDGTFSGTGSLTKAGAGILTLTRDLSFPGNVTVNGGGITQSGGTWGNAAVTVNNGATFRLANGAVATPNLKQFRANAGGAFVYDNATLEGGFLSGTGTHTVGSGGAYLRGTRFAAGTKLAINGDTTFDAMDASAVVTLNQGADLSWLGGSLTSSGQITANNGSVVDLDGVELNGVIAANRGSRINNVGASLVLGGGSRTRLGTKADITGNVSNKAVLDLGGQSLEVNGGLLVNNGIIQNGRVNVNFGGVAKGSGSYLGGYALNDGGKIIFGNSPGTLLSGSALWNPGANLTFQIDNARGIAGTNWGINLIDGSLTLAGGRTSASRFRLSLESLLLGSGDVGGKLNRFSSSSNYSWEWVRTTGGVFGFDASAFTLDSSAFAKYNSLDGGRFSVDQRGNSLFVNFQSAHLQVAAPEPATVAFALVGGVILLLPYRRRMTSSKS